MGNGLEKEEAALQRDLHQHHCARSDDIQKSDDVQNPDGIEDHETGTSQGFFQ